MPTLETGFSSDPGSSVTRSRGSAAGADAGLSESTTLVAVVTVVALLAAGLLTSGLTRRVPCAIGEALAAVSGTVSLECDDPAAVTAHAAAAADHQRGRSLLSASARQCSPTPTSFGRLCMRDGPVFVCPVAEDGGNTPSCFPRYVVDMSQARCSVAVTRSQGQICVLEGVGDDPAGELVLCVDPTDASRPVDLEAAACAVLAGQGATSLAADQQAWCDPIGATVSACGDRSGDVYRCTRSDTGPPRCDSRTFGSEELECGDQNAAGARWCAGPGRVMRCSWIAGAEGVSSNVTDRPQHCRLPTVRTDASVVPPASCPPESGGMPLGPAIEPASPGGRKPLAVNDGFSSWDFALLAFCTQAALSALDQLAAGPVFTAATVEGNALTDQASSISPTPGPLANLLTAVEPLWQDAAASHGLDAVSFPPPVVVAAAAGTTLTLPDGTAFASTTNSGTVEFLPGAPGTAGMIVVDPALVAGPGQPPSILLDVMLSTALDAAAQAAAPPATEPTPQVPPTEQAAIPPAEDDGYLTQEDVVDDVPYIAPVIATGQDEDTWTVQAHWPAGGRPADYVPAWNGNTP